MNINSLITPGKPVIDIGANIGNKTQEFLDLGASFVVAVEMQRELAFQLLARFDGRPVVVVCAAVTDKPGDFVQTFAVPDGNTLNTIQSAWMKGRFSGFQWKKDVKVPTIDLVGLIALSGGDPSYIKIDAEGSEKVIARCIKEKALTPELISFEYTKEYILDVAEIVGYFGEDYEFSYALGESTETVIPFYERDTFLKSIFDSSKQDDSWGAFFARRKK